ncbi:MAG: GGDEF domain-containing response regulator [Spirochaetes bacterium]|jgi:diguanylate cyclase (GGDEF)-like protein|nr:GGDEF domain-containing response regulator [Spirochaetota bacterium]
MANRQIKILVIENNPADINLIQSVLAKDGFPSFSIEKAEHLSEGLARLKDEQMDVVLLNPNLPDCKGFETFQNVFNNIPETPILVLTDRDDETFASKTLQKGAQDYLIKKEYDTGYMARSIRHAIDRHQMLVELRQASLVDELTGLYNRRGFYALCRQQLNMYSRYVEKRLIYVFFADLDRFKWINDSFGHRAGDQALKDTANILRVTFRDSDIVARIGGDEFAILALGSQGVGSQIIINRFHEKIEEFNRLGRRGFQLSVSMGAVQYNNEQYLSINELLFEADSMMYKNKSNKKSADIF